MRQLSVPRAAATACVVALAAVATVVACSDSGTPTSATSNSKGTLSVALTDAPFPFDSVKSVDIFVVRIDARKDSITDAQADSDAVKDDSVGEQSGSWTTIATPKARINLLALQSGKVANLGQVSLPTGTYSGFRMILNTDSSSVTLMNGQVLSGANGGIKFPSAGQTGIKIDLAQPIMLTSTGSLMVIDFDLAHSFVVRGRTISQNGLLFKPVIRATAQNVAGRLSGTVHADSAKGTLVKNAEVDLLKSGTPVTDTVMANVVASTKTDSTGAFKFAALFPATYSLRALPTDTLHTAGYIASVTVKTGADTSVLIVLPKK